MRISLLLLMLMAPLRAQQPEHATVSIGVMSLFHPQSLTVTVPRPTQLRLDAAAIVLHAGSELIVSRGRGGLLVRPLGGVPRGVTRLTVPAATFTLAVPGKLTRTYVGGLAITSTSTALQPIVTLALEAAVASIVAAEAPVGAAPEALKAQAVVARSYLLANAGRHQAFTACDTTHCQYLRAAPPAHSPAALATAATAGLVLQWQNKTVAAMYSHSCGGITRALHPAPAGSYPFYAVRCEYCLRHPERWSRARPGAMPATEQARLAFNRSHGWAAIPSTTYTAAGGLIEGSGTGHGLGLCQLGAQALALRGMTFSAILAHSFPATSVTRLP